MGQGQSTLKKHGYSLQRETDNSVVATKGDDTFLIKKIMLGRTSTNSALTTEIETFTSINHPHIVSLKNSFKGEEHNAYYIVMDYCQGGSLAAKIRKMSDSPQESQILSWIAEICVALRTIHEKGILHGRLRLENVFLTEIGTVCLGGLGTIHDNSESTQSSNNSNQLEINFLPPEVFTEGTYDTKSDIWSLGCILYELCTRQPAFSAESSIKLIPKIISGHYPSLPDEFSSQLSDILNGIFNKDPQSRPTASDILECPIIIHCLSEKCKTTVADLQTDVDKLRDVAEGLERVHQSTTIGSLTGGVIGAVGGITSIVGLILAPFTLGASLIVTGVGVGVSVAGGVTAGASNITNMVNESSDRKAVRSIIKKLEERVNVVVEWLQKVVSSLQNMRSRCDSANITGSKLDESNLFKFGGRAGRGLGGVAELVQLLQVMNIGKIAAQVSRVVRVAEVATGVFAGLFVAIDVFFIAMDAKELYHIRQARAAEEESRTRSESVSETETNDSDPTSDQALLLRRASMNEGPVMAEQTEPDRSVAQNQSSLNIQTPVKSETMKFVHSIREAAHNLQEVVDELRSMISVLPSLED